jgi:hypothetical protein
MKTKINTKVQLVEGYKTPLQQQWKDKIQVIYLKNVKNLYEGNIQVC